MQQDHPISYTVPLKSQQFFLHFIHNGQETLRKSLVQKAYKSYVLAFQDKPLLPKIYNI